MAGGILQNVAKGIEDQYLTNNPNITFFKTVYRRHTNFSKTESDINFTNKLDFGKEGYCRIEHYGDLLHRLFLIVTLPKINITFSTLTIEQVSKLLLTYGIEWTTTENQNNIFTETDYINVKPIIQKQQIFLENENEKIIIPNIESLTGTGKFSPTVWKKNNPKYDNEFDSNGNLISSNNNGISDASEKYFSDIIYDFMDEDTYNLQFKIIDAYNKDISSHPLELLNSVQIQNEMLQIFIQYAIGTNSIPTPLYNSDNLLFLYTTDTANYAISGSIDQVDANTTFRSGISSAYGTTQYTYLDAYNIFNVTLNNNNRILTSTSDIQNIKSILLDNISYGLIKNIRLLENIFNSLNNTSRFIFYRIFSVITVGIANYNTTSSFQTTSLIQNIPSNLNDDFTDVFTLQSEIGQPSDVSHPFSNFVDTLINNENGEFHTNNVSIFNTSLFISYFNDITALWGNLDTYNRIETPQLSSQLPELMYDMNYLWFNMTYDIPQAIRDYLLSSTTNSLSISTNTINNIIFQYLNVNINQQIINIIKPKITQVNNYDILTALNTLTKSHTGLSGDIVLFATILLGGTNTLNGNITIPDFIITTYLNAVDTLILSIPIGSERDDYIKTVNARLKFIINLFKTDISNIPQYSTYISQNNNIYSDPLKQINKILPVPNNNNIYSDVQNSIWYYIFNQFINNYNNLYQENLLSDSYYVKNNGAELENYLYESLYNFFGFNVRTVTNYDYFRNIDSYINSLPINASQGTGIQGYLDNKILDLQSMITNYNNNRPLLDMRNIILSRSQYYFDKFDDVVIEIANIIQTTTNSDGTLVYSHVPYANNDSDIVIATENNLLSPSLTEPRNNAMDIVLSIKNIAQKFFDTAGTPNQQPNNPYNQTTNPNEFSLWNTYVGTFEAVAQSNLFDDSNIGVFDWLYTNTSQQLYNYINQINVLYNGFSFESDVYDFMKDWIIQQSILSAIPMLIGETVDITNQNILNYYQNQLITNNNLINSIDGPTSNLFDILERSLGGGELPRFAWINKIGHYLINQVWIKINDQIIDKQYGEWLEIWHSLTKKIKKENGYNSLIGNINDLTVFNSTVKNSYKLIIPLQFWFCRHIGTSLPLIALHNSDIRVYVKLLSFDEVSYYDDLTTFRVKPKLKCSMLGEYIYVDSEERSKLSISKLEYIIDVVQYNGDITVNKNSINNGYVNTIIQFKNPCKELIWMLQRMDVINGSLPNGQRIWNQYSYDSSNDINPIYTAKIQFGARDREIFKEIEFYNYIQSNERHYSDPNIGVNIYSFSLNPESIQSSGSANMSRLDDVTIIFNFKSNIQQDIILNNVSFRWPIYALSINVLRIFSGQCGLCFCQ